MNKKQKEQEGEVIKVIKPLINELIYRSLTAYLESGSTNLKDFLGNNSQHVN